MPQHHRARLSVYSNSHDTMSSEQQHGADDLSSQQQEPYRQVRPAAIRTHVNSFEEWEREAQRKNLCVGECAVDHQQFREMRARQEKLAEQEKELAKHRHQEQKHQYIQMLPNTDQAQFLAGEAFKRMRNATNMYRGSLKKSYDELDQAIQLLSKEQEIVSTMMQQQQTVPNNSKRSTRKKSSSVASIPTTTTTSATPLSSTMTNIQERKVMFDRVATFVNDRKLAVDLVNYSYVNTLADIVAELQRREIIYRDALMQLLSLEQNQHAPIGNNSSGRVRDASLSSSHEQYLSALRNIQQQIPSNAIQLGPDIENLVHRRHNLMQSQHALWQQNQVLPNSSQQPLYSL